MFLSKEKIKEIQTDANRGVVLPQDVKLLIMEINAIRGNIEEIYSMCLSLRSEDRKRKVDLDELRAIINYVRRMSYLCLRSQK